MKERGPWPVLIGVELSCRLPAHLWATALCARIEECLLLRGKLSVICILHKSFRPRILYRSRVLAPLTKFGLQLRRHATATNSLPFNIGHTYFFRHLVLLEAIGDPFVVIPDLTDRSTWPSCRRRKVERSKVCSIIVFTAYGGDI